MCVDLKLRSISNIAGVLIVAGAASACSSGVSRFEDGYFGAPDTINTGAIPPASVSPQVAAGGSAPVTQGASVASQPYQAGSVARTASAPLAMAPAASSTGSALAPVRQASPAHRTAALDTQPAVINQVQPWPQASAQPGAASAGRQVNQAQPLSQPQPLSQQNPAPQELPQPLPQPGDAAILSSAPSTRDRPAGNRETASLAPAGADTGTGARPSGETSYVVQSGDTLSKIARSTGISVDALKQANQLSGATIRIGQRLVIPAGAQAAPVSGNAVTAQPSASGQPEATEKAARVASQGAAAGNQNAQPVNEAATAKEPKTSDGVAAAAAGSEVAAATPQATGIGTLRWPLKGQVITGYGATVSGGRNDGIDILAPEGTPIKAAENGIVIYAGDGLKEYGNTVLIRHDDGLVTVYGHAREIMVARGDKVTRGQTIAETGMSGTADRPKLHFEVRKDAKPVDPKTYLE